MYTKWRNGKKAHRWLNYNLNPHKNLMKDTIQSVYKHKKNEVFNNVGKSDITHHISFNLVSKIAKKFQLKCSDIITQSDFLVNLGILERAEIISRSLPFTKKANIYFRLNCVSIFG